MNFRLLQIVTAMAIVVGIAAASVVPAFAEEGSVKAVAAWKGRSFAFPVGADQVYLVGVYSGVMFVDDGKGPLQQALVVCHATARDS